MDALILEQQDNTVKTLKRALYYESQYRNAITAGALSLYDANLSKDIIESDFFFRNEKGEFISVPEQVGIKTPCRFSDFIRAYSLKMIPEPYRQKITSLQNLKQTLIDTYNSGNREFTTDYWVENSQGKKYYLNHRFLLTKNEAGDICALSIVKDYTKNISDNEDFTHKQLEQLAYFDSITNGYNYIKFKERLNLQETNGSIISLDIHDFKIINSICGITKGDQVIKAIWEIIISTIDIEKGELSAHINADHYIIFLPTIDGEKIIRTIKNISLAISMIPSELKVPQLNPYFGVASWEPGKRVELSYSEAVAAKHNAKTQKNLNYAFFNEEDTLRLITEKTMMDSFEDALAKREFKIWFQPKINPLTNKLVGAEALIRWIISDGSMIPPGQFIPLFEKNNIIRVLDEYIFRNTCMILKKWQDEGMDIVPVSINISRASLYYHDVANRYKTIADKIGIDKKYIPLEITESAAITNKQIQEISDLFYDAGFSLHMDDFGSGYSSLASLNTMHFDTLKLDKSLIDFIGNPKGDRLLEHTICLAKELGMHITAEGVEHTNQVNFLKFTGCDSIQGYFYSPPIPQREFEKLMKNNAENNHNPELDEVIEHITKFNQSFIKPAFYSFVVNLTKDYFTKNTGSAIWEDSLNLTTNIYSQACLQLSECYISEKYRDEFLAFMDRNKILENFHATEETKMFVFERKLNGEKGFIRITFHIFRIQNSDDIWGYISAVKC